MPTEGTNTPAAGEADGVSFFAVIGSLHQQDPFRVYIYAATMVILLLMAYKIIRFRR